MRYLGIDYGSKNVGLALSDEAGLMAFPLKTVKNSTFLLPEIKDVCKKEDVRAIIIGESLDYNGKENPIMKKIKPLAEKLKKETGLEVFFEPEFMTSVEAGRIQGENKKTDASAAALILKSYLDKEKHNNK